MKSIVPGKEIFSIVQPGSTPTDSVQIKFNISLGVLVE